MHITPNGGIAFTVPAIIKARLTKSGQRLIDICCSSESCDDEGDVILRSALLGAADAIVKGGHIDLDHCSELAARMALPHPGTHYIIGTPLSAGPGTTTHATAMLHQGRAVADQVWASLTGDPDAKWRSSIYGFPLPGRVIDARREPRHPLVVKHRARRFVVAGLTWKSQALSRHPVNRDLDVVRVLRERQLEAA
jgi:hypothetical protein